MSVTTSGLVPSRHGGPSVLWRRQLDSYPNTTPRVLYLAITVLATITLYYELYVGGAVSTLLLANLRMTFTFYVVVLAFANLIGAFGSLFAGLADRWGRANLVVGGLLITGVMVGFIMPAATSKWPFTIELFILGLVEGICLVATPALIRDFSPQVGRATAMGFWTSGPTVATYAAKYRSQIAFVQAHPTVVATAQKYHTQLANAAKFAPELAVIKAHPALFTKLASYPSPAAIPPKLLAQAVAAAGGGATGTKILTTIGANGPAINGVIAVAPQLAPLAPYSAPLAALAKVPPQVFPYLAAHGAAVQKAAAQQASQWRTWYWVCFGGIVFFLLSIPLLRGRWRPSRARADEEAHNAMVEAELAKLSAAGAAP
jgi:hypothetical protein